MRYQILEVEECSFSSVVKETTERDFRDLETVRKFATKNKKFPHTNIRINKLVKQSQAAYTTNFSVYQLSLIKRGDIWVKA